MFTAEARAVTVARRRKNADTAFVELVVNSVYVQFVDFSGKTARRAERHIDAVDFEQNRVFQSKQDVFRLTARTQIGENLHKHKLRIHRNSRDNVVFTADNARNVRAVLGVVRENVDILVRIVVRKRNFAGHVNLVYVDIGSVFCGVGLCQNALNVLFGERHFVCVKISLEHRVSAIETAVKYSNRRIFARIRHAGRVENTRFVHVDEVGDRRCTSRRSGLRTIVGVADYDARNTA